MQAVMLLFLAPQVAAFVAPRAAAFVAPARAAEGPDADRPDRAESPRVVPGRAVQLEAGWSREWLDAAPGRGRTLDAVGEALVRIGLGSGWEGRLTLPSWCRDSHDSAGGAARSEPLLGVGVARRW